MDPAVVLQYTFTFIATRTGSGETKFACFKQFVLIYLNFISHCIKIKPKYPRYEHYYLCGAGFSTVPIRQCGHMIEFLPM